MEHTQKTIFIKSGSYYETPGVSASCAIDEYIDTDYTCYVKTDNAFKLDFIDGEYRFYLPHHIPGASPVYRTLRLEQMVDAVDKYGFAIYGIVTDPRAVVTTATVMNEMTFISYDKKQRAFVNALTESPYPGTNTLPVMYCIKMTDNVYAVYLSEMARINSSTTESGDGINTAENMSVVTLNDGQSIQSRFIDLRFTNAIRHFRNMDLITGYAVYLEQDTTVELDIFKDSPLVTEKFKEGFFIETESNLQCILEGDKIVIQTPKEKTFGFLSVRLKTNPLYEDISSREIRELLSFDFMLFVV